MQAVEPNIRASWPTCLPRGRLYHSLPLAEILLTQSPDSFIIRLILHLLWEVFPDFPAFQVKTF